MLKNIQNIIPLIRMERENMIQNINLQIGVHYNVLHPYFPIFWGFRKQISKYLLCKIDLK